ncbi:MAG: hypothetical protein ACP5EN_08055 [Rhodovulum sp.]
MAQSGNGNATRDDLERQIEALKSDISDISHTLAQMGAERRDTTVEGVQEAAASMQRKGTALGEQATDAVRQQPATAMALAVTAGFIAGLMTGRR